MFKLTDSNYHFLKKFKCVPLKKKLFIKEMKDVPMRMCIPNLHVPI